MFTKEGFATLELPGAPQPRSGRQGGSCQCVHSPDAENGAPTPARPRAQCKAWCSDWVGWTWESNRCCPSWLCDLGQGLQPQGLFPHLREGHQGTCLMRLCDPAYRAWCGARGKGSADGCWGHLPLCSPCAEHAAGTEQGFSSRPADGRKDCGLHTVKCWVSVSFTAPRPQGFIVSRVHPPSLDSDCRPLGKGPICVSHAGVSAALGRGGCHMSRRGGFCGSPSPGNRRHPSLLTRWVWPPPQWLSNSPQIHGSRQDPLLSPLGLALGFPGHLRGGTSPAWLSALEMVKQRLREGSDSPEVSQKSLAWTQDVLPQNCVPLRGKFCLPPSPMCHWLL